MHGHGRGLDWELWKSRGAERPGSRVVEREIIELFLSNHRTFVSSLFGAEMDKEKRSLSSDSKPLKDTPLFHLKNNDDSLSLTE